VLPCFAVYAAGIYWFFGLFKNKWRFTSLPDLMAVVKVATVLTLTLLALDYELLAPNVYGKYFFGKLTIVLYWFLQIFFLLGLRVVYRYFRYARPLQHARQDGFAPTLVLGPSADAEVLLRSVENGAVKKVQVVGVLSPSLADRNQTIRGIPVMGDFSDL